MAEEAGAGSWTRGFTIGDDRIEVRRLLEHALHDSRHHLLDVERGLAQLRSSNVMSSFVSRWVVRRERRLRADVFTADGIVRADAVEQWIGDARDEYLARCRVVAELIEAVEPDVARPDRRAARSPDFGATRRWSS